VLQQLNTTHRRTVPPEAPTDFVSRKWRPYVVDPEGHIDRHYYELCTLWELRGALRAGDVWVASSRRYANPDTYLIPRYGNDSPENGPLMTLAKNPPQWRLKHY